MHKNQSFMWRKGLVLSATFLFSLFLIASCKKKDSFIGQNSINQNDLLSSGGIEIFDLTTFTILEDSIISDNPAFGIIGSYNDPVFGVVNSEIYTQFRLSGLNPSFGITSDIIIDSFVLGLEYVGFYGESGNQTFEVFEINDADGLSIDSTYYSFSTKSTTGVNLVPPGSEIIDLNTSNVTVISHDTIDSQLRINLDTLLARSIIDESISNLTTFNSNENFNEFFKGLHIRTNNPSQFSGEGGLFYLNLNDALSKLTIYYRQDGIRKTYDLLINSSAADFNHVDVDNSMTNVETVINDTVSGQTEFYSQSFGSRAVVQIPFLDNLPENIVVHKATLELPVQYQSGSKYNPGFDVSVATRIALDDPDLYGVTIGSYDDYSKQFTIDLQAYVQAISNGEQLNTELIISPILFITTGDRIIFNGQNTTNKAKPKFTIIYTEY